MLSKKRIRQLIAEYEELATLSFGFGINFTKEFPTIDVYIYHRCAEQDKSTTEITRLYKLFNKIDLI